MSKAIPKPRPEGLTQEDAALLHDLREQVARLERIDQAAKDWDLQQLMDAVHQHTDLPLNDAEATGRNLANNAQLFITLLGPFL